MTAVLYLLACGAPPTRDLAKPVKLAQERGWDVCVITSPKGREFADVEALEALTGHPVRSDYKKPGTPDVLPPPDALLLAPATTNTINKWAAGISDTLPLGLLVEATGAGRPIVAVPFTNQAQAAHPAFAENVARLRSWGVRVLWGEGVMPSFAPRGGGADRVAEFPWQRALENFHQEHPVEVT